MDQALQTDLPDRGMIFALLERQSALELELKKNRIGLMLDIRSLVSPEQWQKMERIQAERRMGAKKRLGRDLDSFEPPVPPAPPSPPTP